MCESGGGSHPISHPCVRMGGGLTPYPILFLRGGVSPRIPSHLWGGGLTPYPIPCVRIGGGSHPISHPCVRVRGGLTPYPIPFVRGASHPISHPISPPNSPPPQLGLGRWSNPQYVEFITVLEDSHRRGTPEVKLWGWGGVGGGGGGRLLVTPPGTPTSSPKSPSLPPLPPPNSPPTAQVGRLHLRLPQLACGLPLGQRRAALVSPAPNRAPPPLEPRPQQSPASPPGAPPPFEPRPLGAPSP